MMKNEKIKTHGIQLLLRMVVRDPDGKIINDTGLNPTKSFVLQFLVFIYGHFSSQAAPTAKAVDGSLDRIRFQTDDGLEHFRMDAGGGVSTYGIVVGTGDTVESNVDYKLASQLGEGATVGKITHSAVSITVPAVAGANVDLELKRSFTNNTGSAIVIKEAGIYTIFTGYEATGKAHCIIRDVFPGPVNVPNYCSLSVHYTLRTTV